MNKAQDLLRIEDLRIAFALHGEMNEVVKGVSLRVPAGKTVALVGESGSGKSVISQAVMGLLPKVGHITGGRILFADPKQAEHPPVDIAALDRDSPAMRAIRGARISMIFQEPMSSLSPVHTVGDQVEEALTLHRGLKGREAREVTERMFSHVGFRDASRIYGQYPFELSGGLRQRAMLAMALICQPSLLIADEPTTALDVTIQAQVLRLMKSLQAELGMAILLITHDLGVVANMADEVAVIYQGEMMEMGPVAPIFRAPKHPYLKALLNASPRFDMKPGERLVALREVAFTKSNAPPSARFKTGERVLEVKNLEKSYGMRGGGIFGRKAKADGNFTKAVDDISLDIYRGECLGIVGESGSGKTTLGNLIMRARAADGGQVLFHEGGAVTDVLKLSPKKLKAFRPNIQMIFQDPVSSLSPRMSVFEILREPMVIQGRLTLPEQRARAEELMRLVGLDPRFLNRFPHSFSGGQRQRIGIARALALEPDVIICDEPVSALDVSVQAQVLNLLKDLQASMGLTYLFISHNLAVVHYMAERIAVMARGRVVEYAPRDAIFNDPRHPYTKQLLAAVPYADLDQPLDFNTLAQGSASDPTQWGMPFYAPDARPELREVSPGHFVLMLAGDETQEIAA